MIKLNIIILFLSFLMGCNEVVNNGSKLDSTNNIQEDDKGLLSESDNQNLTIFDKRSLKYLPLSQWYKFVGVKDSIHYVLMLKRTSDTTIVYQTDSDSHNAEMHFGTATLHKGEEVRNEKSVVTGNIYEAYEFLEELDSFSYRIRVGIDSIGSGDRLLVRLIKNEAELITLDLNMAN